MSDDEPIRNEIKKQLIITVFTVGTAVVLYAMTAPDTVKTVKMWTALKLKHLAQTQVDMWQKLADHAATAYNKEKL